MKLMILRGSRCCCFMDKLVINGLDHHHDVAMIFPPFPKLEVPDYSPHEELYRCKCKLETHSLFCSQHNLP